MCFERSTYFSYFFSYAAIFISKIIIVKNSAAVERGSVALNKGEFMRENYLFYFCEKETKRMGGKYCLLITQFQAKAQSISISRAMASIDGGGESMTSKSPLVPSIKTKLS